MNTIHQTDRQTGLTQNWSDIKKYHAFTLAEVLITLGVIGIVAALTIPQLNNATRYRQWNEKFKVVFSELQQAATTIQTNNGGTFNSAFGNVSDQTAVVQGFANVMKTVASGGGSGGFTHTAINPHGDTVTTAMDWDPFVALANGACISAQSHYPQCNWNTDTCSRIDVDVNCKQGPNILGVDIYTIWLTSKGFVPSGQSIYAYNGGVCSSSDTGTYSGYDCSLHVLQGEYYPFN